MEIYRAKMSRAKLAAMPETERVLLLLAHASNEINVLSKLILMMRKDTRPRRSSIMSRWGANR
jgi:hypothetical protein